jgi:tetratricopeptide (TPR) repeat protein
MHEQNVLAWDFAKLETELKVRVLPVLFAAPTTRTALLATAGFRQWKTEPRDEDVDRMLFFFLFEKRLADLTEKIVSEASARDSTLLPPELATSDEWINRLLRFLWRVRKEAALCLGFRRGRQRWWLEELYFALAVYGLCNANPRWDYEPPQVLAALVSAGVAAARLERRTGLLRDQIVADDPPAGAVGSYRVPLAHAHRRWKADRLDDALVLLEKAHAAFPLAVPLRQEYAMVLVDLGDRKKTSEYREVSLKLLEPLRMLCRKYRDHETLARLGKVFRSHGDAVWHSQSHADFLNARANDLQYYDQARECYSEAFAFNDHYYPGINAATLAWITGDAAHAKTVAQRVRAICQGLKVGDLTEDDRIWLFATEGEACLLIGALPEAVRLYQDALDRIHPLQKKMAQTMYDQVCRLWWALGPSRVQGVVELFQAWARKHGDFTPGPFGNCTDLSGIVS